MLLLHAVSVFYCLLCVIASVWGQIIKTSLKDTESVLLCESSNSVLGETYQWSELVPPSDSIPMYVVGNGILTNSTNQKYSNFKTDVSSYPTSVPLTIEDVVPEDEGIYQCSAAFAQYFILYEVVVEVPGTANIKNESLDVESLTVSVGESYGITCSATGTRSRNELSLAWEPPLDGGTLVKQPNGDFIDYTITSTYTPKKEDRSIICQLTGYVLQDEIKHLVSDSISLVVQSFNKTTKESSHLTSPDTPQRETDICATPAHVSRPSSKQVVKPRQDIDNELLLLEYERLQVEKEWLEIEKARLAEEQARRLIEEQRLQLV